MNIALVIFLVTYLGVALGRIPGLALDRTGMALLGAIAMIAAGVLTQPAAVAAVDMSTILLLYALMVVSAQLRLGGFYTWAALSMNRFMARPARFLLIMMVLSALLSAVLANDIVCLAFTPVLAISLLRAGLNPVPFLIGLAVSSNLGSAATIIGNPQNMLIGQVGQLHFGRFLAWCAPPSILALAGAYGLIVLLFRGRLKQTPVAVEEDAKAWPKLDRHQTQKGLVATAVLMVLFFTPLPRDLVALSVAGILLCSRKTQTRTILGLVDWHLISLFIGLFVVIAGLASTGLPARALEAMRQAGLDIQNVYVLTIVSSILSNMVSNVPATMLFVKFMDPANPVPWYVLALATTYAGNLLTIGSIANLITFEQAKNCGIHISFREHARVGIPVTLLSLGIVMLWIWMLGAVRG